MIERTHDYRIVKKILKTSPLISSKVIYLLENKMNLWSFYSYKDGLKIHANMDESCRGRKAVESAKKAFRWIFENTGFDRIYAKISMTRMDACRVAAWSGMRFMECDNGHRVYIKIKG